MRVGKCGSRRNRLGREASRCVHHRSGRLDPRQGPGRRRCRGDLKAPRDGGRSCQGTRGGHRRYRTRPRAPGRCSRRLWREKGALGPFACNERLFNACYLWAFASLTASPGARAYYDLHRSRGKAHNHALRALANRLVAILHGYLRHGQTYEKSVAWPVEVRAAA